MDAYQGFNVDDRPKFNVAIIYEDEAAGKWAKHFYDRVIRLSDRFSTIWSLCPEADKIRIAFGKAFTAGGRLCP